jgi:kynurenine formamidase
MKLIDVTVPLDARLPTYPGHPPFILEANKCLTRGDSSNVSTLHLAHAGTHRVGVTSSGAERLIACGMLSLRRIVGADGAPARVRLQRQ